MYTYLCFNLRSIKCNWHEFLVLISCRWIKMLSDVLEFCGVIKFNWSKELMGETTTHYFNRVLKMLVITNSAITPYLYTFNHTLSTNKPPSATLTRPTSLPLNTRRISRSVSSPPPPGGGITIRAEQRASVGNCHFARSWSDPSKVETAFAANGNNIN